MPLFLDQRLYTVDMVANIPRGPGNEHTKYEAWVPLQSDPRCFPSAGCLILGPNDDFLPNHCCYVFRCGMCVGLRGTSVSTAASLTRVTRGASLVSPGVVTVVPMLPVAALMVHCMCGGWITRAEQHLVKHLTSIQVKMTCSCFLGGGGGEGGTHTQAPPFCLSPPPPP